MHFMPVRQLRSLASTDFGTVALRRSIESVANLALPAPVSKDVAFSLDYSGSMSGGRIKRAVENMLKIFDQARPGCRCEGSGTEPTSRKFTAIPIHFFRLKPETRIFTSRISQTKCSVFHAKLWETLPHPFVYVFFL